MSDFILIILRVIFERSNTKLSQFLHCVCTLNAPNLASSTTTLYFTTNLSLPFLFKAGRNRYVTLYECLPWELTHKVTYCPPPPLVPKEGGSYGPLNCFEWNFWIKIAPLIEYIKLWLSTKKKSRKKCSLSKCQPFYRFSFCMIAHTTKSEKLLSQRRIATKFGSR